MEFNINLENKRKYKCGYCMAFVNTLDFRNYGWLKEMATQCEHFILGIPNYSIVEKLMGKDYIYDPAAIRDYWLNIKWIDDVIILNEEYLDYSKMYEIIKFDVCFHGSEYGARFRKDADFMKKHNVEFVPALPSKINGVEGLNALEISLKYHRIFRKIILFGTGNYFEYYMKYYGEKYRPYYAIDNAEEKWETKKEGISIKNPIELTNENSEDVFVIICCKNYMSVLTQLNEMGKYDYRLLLYQNEIALLEDFFLRRTIEEDTKETIRKIHEINYDLLEEFDRVCRTHDVQYFLNYGSLLGAVRHKGFIPWDNDIDVVMTRENYDKLSYFKEELDKHYYWLPIDMLGNRKYYDSVPRVGYKEAYICLEREVCQFYENQNNRIHLDMFFIDKTYDNFRGKWQRFELAVLYGLMNAYRHESFFFDYDKKMRFANAILRRAGRLIPLSHLRKRADKVARRFDKDENAPYFFISNDVLRKLHMLFPKEVFDHAINMKFGRVDASVACGYESMCRIIFGEYMNLPPENERVPHLGRLLITSDLYVFQEPNSEEV